MGKQITKFGPFGVSIDEIGTCHIGCLHHAIVFSGYELLLQPYTVMTVYG